MKSSERYTKLAMALMVATIFGFGAAEAQSNTGRIIGQVVDAETARPLPGAQVVVTGTSVGTLAGLDGRYQLVEVPAGSVELEVSMMGFATKRVAFVQVPPGGGVRMDVQLEPSAVQLEGIMITAQQERGSQVMALSEQRAAIGVQNSISSDQISRSPDGDAAAAVRRVSGVSVQDGKYVQVRGLGERYTTSSLNGARIPSPEPERKVVPLDLFPAGMIQSIRTSKTFSPHQPGDFSGGSVDIRTREFPLDRQLSISLSSGFHPDVTGRSILRAPLEGREWLALGTDPRSLPDAAANMPSDATRGPAVNQVVNSFRNRWLPERGTGWAPVSASATLGGNDEVPLVGHELGYLVSGTYSVSDEVQLDQRRARAGADGSVFDAYEGQTGRMSVLWGGIVNLSTRLGSHSRLAFNNTYNRSADNEARQETGVDENTSAEVQIDRLTYTERSVRAHQLAGEHQVHARHRLDWTLASSSVNRSEPDRSEFVTWLDPEVPVWFNDFEGAVRSFAELDEVSHEGTLDYQATFDIAGRRHEFRAGGRMRTTSRDALSTGFRIQAFSWSEDDPRWQLSPEEFFDGRFATDADSTFLLSRELAGGSYSADDDLTAWYGMVDIGLTSWARLVTGARVEDYSLSVRSENQVGQESIVDRAYQDVLPALALNLDVASDHKLRLSVARTLARPEYRELAPITYREVLGGEQVIGNQDLERTLIDNYDIRWEWYPGLAEVVSVGLFAKRFQNPIEQRFLARSGTDTRTFENAESATNVGVEVEVMKNLAFVASSLEPLSLFANATFMESEVDTGNPDDVSRRMVGQAPYLLNAGIAYAGSRNGLSATALYNVVGPRIVNARASGSDVDDVEEVARHMVDLSVRFPMAGGAAGKIDFKNLLDAPYEVVQGSATRNFHRTGRSVSFGVSLQF